MQPLASFPTCFLKAKVALPGTKLEHSFLEKVPENGPKEKANLSEKIRKPLLRAVSQSCLTLCNPMNCSPPGSSVHRISQARILEWLAVLFFRGFSWPRDQTRVPCIAGRFFGASLVAQRLKRLPPMRETQVQSWVGKISWRRKWQPTPVFLPGESHGQRSLVGYDPWGCKALDTTERFHFLFFLYHLGHQGSSRCPSFPPSLLLSFTPSIFPSLSSFYKYLLSIY